MPANRSRPEPRARAVASFVAVAIAFAAGVLGGVLGGVPGGGTAAAGSGLLATVAASSTGLVGCCGSALSGGVLALIGVSSTTAAQIAEASPLLQVALIAGFALNYLRLRRRRRLSSIDVAGGQRR